MKQFLKDHFKFNHTIGLDNSTTDYDNLVGMECRQIKNEGWRDGYNLIFNGEFKSYKTFNAFYKEFCRLKDKYNMQLCSWG